MKSAPPDSAHYRDARPGAEAKRDDLLTRARAELAAQSLEIRRVFVSRVSWAAAGASLAIGGLTTGIAVADNGAYDALAGLFPGRDPAVVANLLGSTLLIMFVAYFVVRALAEDTFTRAMLRAANPSADLFGDLDRLEHSPKHVAQRLAQRVSAPAIFAFTAGVGVIAAPAAIAFGAILSKDGWNNPGAIDTFMRTFSGASMVQAALGAVILASCVSRAKKSRPALAIALVASGLLACLFGGGAAIWGISVVGVGAGMVATSFGAARQTRLLAGSRSTTSAASLL